MKLTTAYKAGRLTIYLKGELDHHWARSFMQQIEDAIDQYMPRDCVLDMSSLSFMDSSGIALIIKVGRRMNAMGGRAWIEDPAKQPQRVIEAAGIDRMVPLALSK